MTTTRCIPPSCFQPSLLFLAIKEATGQTGGQPNDLRDAEGILEQDAAQDDADALSDVVANHDGGGGKVFVQSRRAQSQSTTKQTRQSHLSPDLATGHELVVGIDLTADADEGNDDGQTQHVAYDGDAGLGLFGVDRGDLFNERLEDPRTDLEGGKEVTDGTKSDVGTGVDGTPHRQQSETGLGLGGVLDLEVQNFNGACHQRTEGLEHGHGRHAVVLQHFERQCEHDDPVDGGEQKWFELRGTERYRQVKQADGRTTAQIQIHDRSTVLQTQHRVGIGKVDTESLVQQDHADTAREVKREPHGGRQRRFLFRG